MVITQQKKQVVMLYTSTLMGVFMGVLCSIVNTRFLNPAEYGDVRYVQNIINFVATFLLFGYFLSGARLMALSNDRNYVARIKAMMLIILVTACLLLSMAMPVNYFLHTERPQVAWLFLLSMPVCFYPLFQNYIEQTAQGDNQIGLLSLARLLPHLIYVPIGYAIYSTFGATSERMVLLQWGLYSAIYLVIIFATKPLFHHLKPIWKKLNEENRDYGLQLYIGSIVMVSTNYLAGISLGYFNEDNSEVGFYTLALTVTSPLAALPAIVGTTYFKKFATQPAIPQKVITITVGLTITTCFIFILLIHPVVEFLYTDRYAVVGTYASILSVGFCIHGLGDMFNRYLCSHGQGGAVRNASIANGVFKLLGYTFLVWLFNTNGAIATTIICDIIYFGCLIIYYTRFIKQPTNG